MSSPVAAAHSLFTPSGSETAGSKQAKLEHTLQRFEGMLWDQVTRAMSDVKLGPSNLGYGGHLYRRMLWHKVASRDLAETNQKLTRATLQQLLPGNDAPSTPSHRANGNAGIQAASPAGETSNQTPQDWAHNVWGAIRRGAKALGVPAQGLLAQAALETGWGRHVNANNLFGVKAHGQGADFTALTHEFTGGVMHQVHAAFQGYRSVAHSVDDFVQLLRRLHPRATSHTDVAGYAQALQDSGYATDPRYAHKIEAVAASALMRHILASVKQ